MKHILFVLILSALVLGACSPAATPTALPSATASAVPSPTQPATTKPASTPTQPPAATATPTATLLATAPPTSTAPTTAAMDFQQVSPDCTNLSGFPACGGNLPLSGKLATYDPNRGMIRVLDFQTKLAWEGPAPDVQRMEWLDHGNFLMIYNKQNQPSLAWANPATSKTVNLPATSPQGTPVFTAADGSTAWMGQKDLQFSIHVRLAKSDKETVWPAEGQPSDQIHELLGWVPDSTLLLAGYHFSSNSMWVTGNRLYTLDAANGATQEMDANLRLGGSFQWNPVQPNLMVFGDSNQSPVMGAPLLAVLDVHTGKATHLFSDTSVSSTYPSWTPDGKAILHAASTVGSPPQASDPFALAAIYLTQWPDGTTRRLTQPAADQHDDWPQLLPDAQHFLYLRVSTNNNTVELRLGTLDGSQDSLIVSGLAPSPQSPLPIGPNWDRLIAYAP